MSTSAIAVGPSPEVTTLEKDMHSGMAGESRPDSNQTWHPSASAEKALCKLLGQIVRLPAVPALYAQVVSELGSPRGSIDFVARLVAKEPAMTAKLLQAVNSAHFAPVQRISSPFEAVLFLGTERTKALILLAKTLVPFDGTTCANFSLTELWRHSMAVGAFATKIAQMEKLDAQGVDECFTAGLLHDIGKLLLAGNLPKEYARAIERSVERRVPLLTVEEEMFGITHADLGGVLMRAWGLSIPLINAVGWHHDPKLSRDSSFSLLTAVHAANAIDHELRSCRGESPASVMDAEYIAGLGMAERRTQWQQACSSPFTCFAGSKTR